MKKWLNENLSNILDFPVPDDLIKYILKIENERDLDEYLRSLLNFDDPHHRQFIVQLKKKRVSNHSGKDLSGYKKPATNEESSQKSNDKKKGKIKAKETLTVTVDSEKVEEKKKKFVNLYSQEGRDRGTVLLKGRYRCNCEAAQHNLINNCLNCGRIVCAQEGAGPCFFCGELVCSVEQQQILASNTKQADHLYNKLMDQKRVKDYEDSLKQRDRLLKYDRISSQRKKVIDDQSDYYQSNSVWLSREEREKWKKREEKLHAQKHQSKLNQKVTLDFAGREVVDQDFESIKENYDDNFSKSYDSDSNNICPSVQFERPKYIELNLWPQKRNCVPLVSDKNRIQDKEYLEMVDDGYCLSMHQPYASLLVAGIKIHEGRTWYSSHRGRLWIASAAKVPSVEEISTLESHYRVLKNEYIKFPESYPPGCLLGCVTVTDVLPQEEYQKLYPEGENDSPYVFICEDCYQLPINLPIQGKHKIYKLDPKIHRAAVKSLERVMKIN